MQPAHTDQCIRDAAQFGFCAHTRLPRDLHRPSEHRVVYSPPQLDPPQLTPRARIVFTLLPWVGFTCLAIATYLLATRVPFLITALVILLFGLGWLLIFARGIPPALKAALMWDPRTSLPDPHAAYEQLWDRPSPYRPTDTRPNPRRRRQDKQKGPGD